MNIKLELPKLTDLKPRITVMGIGGAGCNAVNNMIATSLDGVEFVVANTDAQSLAMSTAEHRIQLGVNLTEGLGAGAKPEVGEAAAREAEDEIREHFAGSHMAFIAAGMGGGTGTGAATVAAEIARDLGILTVGIVSKPFQFEGARRMRVAEAGIESLEKVVDTLIVIPNQNLFRIANERTTFADAFLLADQVLYSGIACIVDLIVKEGLINLDFADVRAVMTGMGTAVMGTGEAVGEERAVAAAREAISNPLLDNVSLAGAHGLLVSIVGGKDMTLYEVDAAASTVRKEVAAEANIIVGASFDDTMNETIRVSIVASGISSSKGGQKPAEISTGTPAYVQAPEIPAPPPIPSQASSPPEPEPEIDEMAYRQHEAEMVETAAPDLPPPADTSPDAAGPDDAGMSDSDADDFARALRQAMSEAENDAPIDAHQDTPPPPADEEWRTPDGVVIEEGFATPTVSAPAPPPLPDVPPANGGPAAFEPQPPATVRRPAPRMPEVSDFPEIAQREYFAKAEAPPVTSSTMQPQPPAPAVSHPAPPVQRAEPPARSQPPQKQGLFRRLTGFGRRDEGDSAAAQDTHAGNQHDASHADGAAAPSHARYGSQATQEDATETQVDPRQAIDNYVRSSGR